MNKIITDKIEFIKELCSRYDVKSLYVFGSASTDKFNEKSDLDFLISFSDELSIEDYTENYFTIHYKLQEIFKKEIDLITEKSLSNPFFIKSLNKTKSVLYESRN